MSHRVPLRRCRRCVRFDGVSCHLDDLQPCSFIRTPEAEDQRAADIFLFFVTAIAIFAGAFLFALAKTADTAEPAPAPVQHSAVQLLREQRRAELTDWQALQMAIIWTESRCNPDAQGADGDTGLMQIVPIYIREVNRLAGTDYTIEDARDPAKTLEMFEIIQEHYNPTHDRDEAIRHHNRSASYRAAVLENLELIRRYENARKYVIK